MKLDDESKLQAGDDEGLLLVLKITMKTQGTIKLKGLVVDEPVAPPTCQPDQYGQNCEIKGPTDADADSNKIEKLGTILDTDWFGSIPKDLTATDASWTQANVDPDKIIQFEAKVKPSKPAYLTSQWLKRKSGKQQQLTFGISAPAGAIDTIELQYIKQGITQSIKQTVEKIKDIDASTVRQYICGDFCEKGLLSYDSSS